MIKRDEIKNPESCFNKARIGERVFVLLERDEAAPDTIRFWIQKRIELGKNTSLNLQIQEAERCAFLMEQDRKKIRDPEHLDTLQSKIELLTDDERRELFSRFCGVCGSTEICACTP